MQLFADLDQILLIISVMSLITERVNATPHLEFIHLVSSVSFTLKQLVITLCLLWPLIVLNDNRPVIFRIFSVWVFFCCLMIRLSLHIFRILQKWYCVLRKHMVSIYPINRNVNSPPPSQGFSVVKILFIPL